MKVGRDTLHELVRSEQANGFNDLALGMNPMRLNAIEPRTLAGQEEGHDAHTFALSLAGSIVCLEPGTHGFTDVPSCVVPNLLRQRLGRSRTRDQQTVT
jgi:hypothetical protein